VFWSQFGPSSLIFWPFDPRRTLFFSEIHIVAYHVPRAHARDRFRRRDVLFVLRYARRKHDFSLYMQKRPEAVDAGRHTGDHGIIESKA
jgi:hypothetical protein